MITSDSLLKNDIFDTEKDVIRKKVTTRDTEIFEVAQLSYKTEPCSKPSGLLAKLEEKRKIRHENLLMQLGASLQEVNSRTEKNIKIASLELKAHLKHFDDKLKDILKSIDKPEVASYSGTVFLEIQNNANKFKCQQEKLVTALHEDLIKFENERAKEIEKLLHLACEEIRKIGYFLPYEVQTFVERETLKMNQLSLNNRRCYEDLKLTLTLLTEQTFKSFMDKVFCIQEKWVQFRLQKALYNLQNKAEKKIPKAVPEAYARLELKGRELLVQFSPDNLYSTCKAEEWLHNVEEVLSAIDSHGKSLIDVYKRALNAVVHGFDNEVEDIKNELNFVETLAIEERVIKPIIFDIQSDRAKEIEGLEMYWQETLTDVKLHLKELTQFLLDTGRLWDKHLERECESKKLILRALEKADKNNNAFFQDMEIKININLDGLRQEHNQGKLEKAYETVVAMLNSLRTKYESVYLEEVATIEDFYKMMHLEADVLSAELKEFIYEIHPTDCTKSMIYHYPDQFRLLSNGKPIFKEIQMCIQQIQAVRTWKFGVWTALETLSEKTRESLKPRAESWVKKKIDSTIEKVSIQMELLEKRLQRIKIEIYEKRIQEISLHQNNFEKHKEKIKFSLLQMKENLQVLTAKELNKMNHIKENLNEIEANAKIEDRPGVIRGNQLMIERKREELENDLKLVFERFRADCETIAFDTRQANIQFMKSIKFFHENGNYSTEEGKMFIALSETVDKEINTELKNIIKDSTKEENDFIKKVSLLFSPPIFVLTSLYEETLFYQENQERLKNFKAEIRNAAKSIKVNFEYLNKQSDSLSNLVQNPMEVVDEIDEKFWNFIIRLLYKNVCNLFYPVTYPDTPAVSVKEEEREESEEGEVKSSRPCCAKKLILLSTTSKTSAFCIADKLESFTCKNYVNQLYESDSPPKDDGTFMTIICNALLRELDFLQRAAFAFFKNLQGRKIIRDDLIPGNYEKFIEEIVAKFKCYNIQVEQFWLQMVLDFFPIVHRIKSTANKFLERKLNDYADLACKTLQDYENNFRSCLECQSCNNLTELEALDNRLLPLYGYPQNTDLLNELEEEVVRRTANQKIKWETATKKFKSQLKSFRCHHIKELSEIKAIEVYYYNLRDKIFVESLGNNLLEAVMDYCNKGMFCIKSSSKDSLKLNELKNEGEDLESGEVPKEHKLNFDDLINGNLHGVKTYLKQLKRLLDTERLSDVAPFENSSSPQESAEFSVAQDEDNCMKYHGPKLNILLPIMNFEEPVGKVLGRLEDRTRYMKSFADSQEHLQEEALFKWLTIWKFNVNKIKKLYRVRYEEKPETYEEPSLFGAGELKKYDTFLILSVLSPFKPHEVR